MPLQMLCMQIRLVAMRTGKFAICILYWDGRALSGAVYPIRNSSSSAWNAGKNASSALRANHLSSTWWLLGYKRRRGTRQTLRIRPDSASILSIAECAGSHRAIIHPSIAWGSGSYRLRISLGSRGRWKNGKRLELLLRMRMGEEG